MTTERDRKEELPCGEARRLLWPLERPRVWSEAEARARRHLEACPGCRAYFRRDRAVREALRRHGTAARAPRELRERVFDALARERALAPGGKAPRGRHGLRVLAAASLIAALALAGSWFLGGDGAHGGDFFVEDFMSRAVEEDVLVSPDAGLVSGFFRREMGVAIQPVALQGAELSRAMICLIKGERVAMVEYDYEGLTVAHYRLPAAAGSERVRPVRTSAERGVAVAWWADGQFEHALVAELPEADLNRLAEERFLAH